MLPTAWIRSVAVRDENGAPGQVTKVIRAVWPIVTVAMVGASVRERVPIPIRVSGRGVSNPTGLVPWKRWIRRHDIADLEWRRDPLRMRRDVQTEIAIGGVKNRADVVQHLGEHLNARPGRKPV